MKTTPHPLNVASDVSETIHLTTSNPHHSTVNKVINEYGDIAFECEIELYHEYYNGDMYTGDAYDFNITNVEVKVINVMDADGQIMKVDKKTIYKIERLLEDNLTFEITKKY